MTAVAMVRTSAFKTISAIPFSREMLPGVPSLETREEISNITKFVIDAAIMNRHAIIIIINIKFDIKPSMIREMRSSSFFIDQKNIFPLFPSHAQHKILKQSFQIFNNVVFIIRDF